MEDMHGTRNVFFLKEKPFFRGLFNISYFINRVPEMQKCNLIKNVDNPFLKIVLWTPCNACRHEIKSSFHSYWLTTSTSFK